MGIRIGAFFTRWQEYRGIGLVRGQSLGCDHGPPDPTVRHTGSDPLLACPISRRPISGYRTSGGSDNPSLAPRFGAGGGDPERSNRRVPDARLLRRWPALGLGKRRLHAEQRPIGPTVGVGFW